MRKRITILTALLLLVVLTAHSKAKYVFYFIGDGMGVNQVNAAETYLGALNQTIGIQPLCFPSFPYAAIVNTQSATNGVTDSAAGGTALATGHKTKNGVLGMLKDQKTAVSSIADWAREAGAAVGIATSVSVDHATPAAFYAHVKDRKDYATIARQLIERGNDFYAGADFLDTKAKEGETTDIYGQAKAQGYTIARGYRDYQKKAKKAEKMILLQTAEASKRDKYSIPYAIDRTKDDMTLTDITRAAIRFLTSKQQEKDGFFLMVEGGKIDWACHANDMSFIPEVIDMDNAVKVAYEFYQQHPDETLIVVTADHETGGLALGRRGYELHLDVVASQHISFEKAGKELHALYKKHGENYDWNVVKNFLTEHFGLWTTVKLSDEQTKRVEQAFQHILEGKGKDVKTLYQRDNELAATVRKVLAEQANVGWSTYDHSNGYVPCFAIGEGAELLTGRIDNTEIPQRMAKAAGWVK